MNELPGAPLTVFDGIGDRSGRKCPVWITTDQNCVQLNFVIPRREMQSGWRAAKILIVDRHFGFVRCRFNFDHRDTVSVPVGDNLGAATFRAEFGANFDIEWNISTCIRSDLAVLRDCYVFAFHEKKQRSSRKKHNSRGHHCSGHRANMPPRLLCLDIDRPSHKRS